MHLSIIIKDRHTHGTNEIIRFGIIRGLESEAAEFLLGRLDEGAELQLRNDLDEGNEGLTVMRFAESGYRAKNGGHGWEGNWSRIDRSEVISKIEALAVLNRGDGHMDRASLVSCIAT